MAESEFDLARCLASVLQHDEEAARVLVERLYPQVIRIVRGHLPRRAAEQDLAQEIFAKLFSRLQDYEPRQSVPFEHWVSRLAVRTCLDALRAEKRRPELRWADLPEEQAAWLESMVAEESEPPDTGAASARELLEHLLSQLKPEDRLVITWLDLDQKPVKEVSQLTGWSLTLVKVRAFRARRKLRKLAERLGQKHAYEQL
jgi:RNA polymerase sigma-70 factor (ECF subfamily)